MARPSARAWATCFRSSFRRSTSGSSFAPSSASFSPSSVWRPTSSSARSVRRRHSRRSSRDAPSAIAPRMFAAARASSRAASAISIADARTLPFPPRSDCPNFSRASATACRASATRASASSKGSAANFRSMRPVSRAARCMIVSASSRAFSASLSSAFMGSGIPAFIISVAASTFAPAMSWRVAFVSSFARSSSSMASIRFESCCARCTTPRRSPRARSRSEVATAVFCAYSPTALTASFSCWRAPVNASRAAAARSSAVRVESATMPRSSSHRSCARCCSFAVSRTSRSMRCFSAFIVR